MILVVQGAGSYLTAKKAEIINTDNSGLTCKNLEEYPLDTTDSVGFNMGSLPVICGGYDYSTYTTTKQCHRMESEKWQPFANLTQGYVLQEVPEFRDFRIRDPRYFVIWFHAKNS